MNWLLCDYGEVLSLAPSEAEWCELETAVATDLSDFRDRYWHYRPPYDAGEVQTDEYWSAVLGETISGPRLHEIVERDVAMWCHPHEDSLDRIAHIAEDGVGLAILSNAPVELARHIDPLPWLSAFSPRLFSGMLGVVKPDPRIYHLTLDALRATRGDVVFLDDRPDNVRAAEGLGIRGVVFTAPRDIELTSQFWGSAGGGI